MNSFQECEIASSVDITDDLAPGLLGLADSQSVPVKISALVPAAVNQQIKAFAKASGKPAAVIAGELIEKSASDLKAWEASTEVERLREKFGPDFLDILAMSQR